MVEIPKRGGEGGGGPTFGKNSQIIPYFFLRAYLSTLLPSFLLMLLRRKISGSATKCVWQVDVGALRKQREVSIKFRNTKSIPYNMPKAARSIQFKTSKHWENRVHFSRWEKEGRAVCSVVGEQKDCLSATPLPPLATPSTFSPCSRLMGKEIWERKVMGMKEEKEE